MTLKKALKLAIKEYGKNAAAQKRNTPPDYPLGRCLVGVIECGFFTIKEHGKTFEDIFIKENMIKKGINKECQQCGNTVYFPQSKKDRKFCSYRCFKKFIKESFKKGIDKVSIVR